MKPYISVIIPAYNASRTLTVLLDSLKKSSFKNFEVIIGDDASNEQYHINKGKGFPCTVVRLTRNRGPAAARNAASKRAKGQILVFLDSDVTVYPDTLEKIAGKFKEDHDLTAVTGVWDKHQRTKAFFPQFKALRDWSYWTNERDRDGYYYLFSTRIAAVRREVFLRLGGFNEAFRQMEDVEFTYRIAKRYAIIFAPDVRVHHEFEDLFPVAKKYFWRSFYWTKLYKERRKFDPVATTVWESMAGISGVASVGLAFIWINLAVGYITGIMNHQFGIKGTPVTLENIIAGTGILALVLFMVHIALLWKFLRFVYTEKGAAFAGRALLTGLLLYCIIITGSLYYSLRERTHTI
jgi:glycosyltransferase involved in cell wall biosynthesis